MTGPAGARPPSDGTDRKAALVRLAALALGLALAGWLLRTVGVAPGTEWVDLYVRGRGWWGEAVFVLAGGAATAAGVPRQAVAFLGGYGFGAWAGTLLSLAAQLLGCAASFLWARLVGGVWTERRLHGRFGPRLRRLRAALRENAFGATLALRLLPVGNNLALNLLAGVAGVAFGPYLLASAIGYLPQTVVFALLGKGVRVDGAWQLGTAVAFLAASTGIGFWLLRRHRAARALAGEGGAAGRP